MGEEVQGYFVFLLEDEIRAAARAIREFHRLHADESATADARTEAMCNLVNTASAALWDADNDSPLILTNAKAIFGKGKRK